MNEEKNYPGMPVTRHPGDSIDGLSDLLDYVAKMTGPGAGGKNFVMAEIGCFSGQSTEIFAQRVDQLIAVDSWDDKKLQGNPALTNYPMSNVKKCFLKRMEKFGNRIYILHASSLEAAKHIPDESLDLVYIDADHRYDAVRVDILTWLPKIKIGGFIGGHDYNDEKWAPHVNRAVHELLGKPDAIFRDCSWLVRIKCQQ